MQVSSGALKRLGVRFVREASGIAEYTLTSNGLKILLLEHHLAPVVTTMIMYRVGSRNEGVGFTGSTHFLEHMMFKSTEVHDSAKGTGFVDMLKPTGANYNAYTGQDSTSYVICLPKEKLGLALQLEADRMRNLRLTDNERHSEMTVVRNEFEIGENEIDDVMYKQLMATAFAEHPYHHPIIGWRDDVEHVPLSRMQTFYDTFYWPNNATLVIAGDFEAEAALNMVRSYFGAINSAPLVIPQVYTREPRQTGARTFEVKREGMEYAKLVIGFPTVEAAHADHHALAVISDLLGGDQQDSSRLYAALLETKIALDCSVTASAARDPDLLTIKVTANGFEKIKAAEKSIHEQLERLRTKRVGQRELQRVKRANRNRSAEIKSDPMKRAEQVCEAEAIADWTWYVDYDEKYDAVTSADVMRVARKYLTADNSTTGHSAKLDKPRSTRGNTDTRSDASDSLASGNMDIVNFASRGAAATTRSDVVEPSNIASRVERFTLDNGLTVLILPVAGSGVVSVSGAIRAGGFLGDKRNALVPELTARMLKTGTRDFGKRELSERLEALGCELDFDEDEFAVTFDSTLVAESLDGYLDLLGSVLQRPRFAPGELKRIKGDMESEIAALKGDSAVAADYKLSQALYPRNHVYFCPSLQTQENHLKRTTIHDVRDFHARHYSPGALVMAVVGEVDIDSLKTKLDAVFGTWTGSEPDAIVVPPVELPANRKRIDVPMPGKSSVEIIIGVPLSLKKTDADFTAAEIANAALGVDTLSSRLGVTIRTKHGLTYGVTSSFDDIRFGHAAWQIQLTVNPANVEKALALVEKVVEDFIRNGITDRELADEAGRLYGTHVVSLRTTSGLANTLCAREFRGAPLQGIDREWMRLHSVTKKQVNNAIRKYLRFDKAVTVVVGK